LGGLELSWNKCGGDLSNLHQLTKKENGLDILLFPVIDWEFRLQRPQQLAKELGKLGNRVIYFATTFNVTNTPGFIIEKMPVDGVVLCKLNINKHEVNIYKDKRSRPDKFPDSQCISCTPGIWSRIYKFIDRSSVLERSG
jgi:hypothetical protein